MRDVGATNQMGEAGRVRPPIAANTNRGDEDWLWMVAADPAFYLEESGGTQRK